MYFCFFFSEITETSSANWDEMNCMFDSRLKIAVSKLEAWKPKEAGSYRHQDNFQNVLDISDQPAVL